MPLIETIRRRTAAEQLLDHRRRGDAARPSSWIPATRESGSPARSPGAALTAVALLHTHGHFDHIGGTAELAGLTAAHDPSPCGRLVSCTSPSEQAASVRPDGESRRCRPGLRSTDGESHPVRRVQRCAPSTRPATRPARSASSSGAPSPSSFPETRSSADRSGGRTSRAGDTEAILASIRGKLFRLPGATPVVCGHGPGTTIEEEKKQNPFAAL